jgi:hypothetical protein
MENKEEIIDNLTNLKYQFGYILPTDKTIDSAISFIQLLGNYPLIARKS